MQANPSPFQVDEAGNFPITTSTPAVVIETKRRGVNTSLVVFIATVGLLLVSISHIHQANSSSGLAKLDFTGMPDFDLEDAPQTLRVPKDFRQFTIDLFSIDKVKAAIDTLNGDAKIVCSGPSNNIDVFINEEAVFGDLMGATGYTAFNLDCRDSNADPQIAFLVVFDHYGNIVNINHLPIRAESVSMMDTYHVIYTTIGGNGAFIWNWKTDDIQQLPFLPDQHALQYVPSKNSFYGLYLDEGAKAKFSPSTVGEYDGKTGEVLWTFEPGYSHANYVSVAGKYIYASLRSAGALMKINRETDEIIWTLGGKYGDVPIYDIDGNYYEVGAKEISWSHQHKFQHLDESFYSLFDNHVGMDHNFMNDENSRMVIIHYDQEAGVAREIFAHDTGDKARIYGSSDLLPTGNVIGNSYPYVVHPNVPDRQYHVNVWEITPEGETAWRLGVKGHNPWNPEDKISAYPHSIDPEEEPPVGWLVYNAERFYEKPTISRPCMEGASVRLNPYNTIKTSEDMAGIAYIYDAQQQEVLAKADFMFHKSWLPRNVDIPVPAGVAPDTDLQVVVVNNWKDSNVFSIGSTSQLPQCSEVSSNRLIK